MEGACWQRSVVGISFLTRMRGERWRGCRPWGVESVKTKYRLQRERRGDPRERHGREEAVGEAEYLCGRMLAGYEQF